MILTETKNKTDHVVKIIRIIIDKFAVDENDLSYQASFCNDLNIDSLDLVEFIDAIEKEFQIKIPDEDAEKLTTVGSVIDYVDKHVN
ncbi:MAG TPA: acyl carrier protein [Puia sp.]|jgi:acyl carrier protein|nr:acyl carrier protein [Puia sp.]